MNPMPACCHTNRYVSFVEVFFKSVHWFEDVGYEEGKAYQYGTLAFFGGMFFTYLLDLLSRFLVAIPAWRARGRQGWGSEEGQKVGAGSAGRSYVARCCRQTVICACVYYLYHHMPICVM